MLQLRLHLRADCGLCQLLASPSNDEQTEFYTFRSPSPCPVAMLLSGAPYSFASEKREHGNFVNLGALKILHSAVDGSFANLMYLIEQERKALLGGVTHGFRTYLDLDKHHEPNTFE